MQFFLKNCEVKVFSSVHGKPVRDWNGCHGSGDGLRSRFKPNPLVFVAVLVSLFALQFYKSNFLWFLWFMFSCVRLGGKVL